MTEAQANPPASNAEQGHRDSRVMLLTDVLADSVVLRGVRMWRDQNRAGWIMGLCVVCFVMGVALLLARPFAAAWLVSILLLSGSSMQFAVTAIIHWRLIPRAQAEFGEVRRAIGVPRSTEQAALAAVLDAALDGRPYGQIDARAFIESTGPSGPRVVWIDQSPVQMSTPEDIAEKVDLRRAGGRPVGAPNGWFLFIGGVLLFSAAADIYISFRSTGLISFGCSEWMLLAVALLWVSKALLLWRSIIGGPGVLKTTAFGRETVFTRQDSVLVVTNAGSQPIAVISRRDGASAMLGQYATSDQRLDALLER